MRSNFAESNLIKKVLQTTAYTEEHELFESRFFDENTMKSLEMPIDDVKLNMNPKE
jgi:hypothetical protein